MNDRDFAEAVRSASISREVRRSAEEARKERAALMGGVAGFTVAIAAMVILRATDVVGYPQGKTYEQALQVCLDATNQHSFVYDTSLAAISHP